MRGISNRETHLHLPHNNPSVNLTTTEVRRIRRIADGMRRGWRTLRSSVLTYPTSEPTLLECPLPRTAWVRLKRLRNIAVRFSSCLHKWSMAPSAICECGAEERTVDHVALHCSTNRLPCGVHGLKGLDDDKIECLHNTCPEIWCGLAGSKDEEKCLKKQQYK